MQPDSPATTKPPLNLVLRAARPADAEALAAMMNLPGFCWGTAQVPFHSPEEVRSRLEKAPSGGRELVAIVDGDLIGSASLVRPTGRRAHIGRIGIGVHDAWVGRRIGSALMAALTDLADNWLDLKRLELEVNVDNVPALALYRRFGFEIEGTHRGCIFRNGQFVDVYSMARIRNLPTSASAASAL